MYHRGGDRGWHHPRDGPPPRNHVSRPYRGGYHDHREHSSYEQYGYGPCQDRNYNDTKYQENSFHEYQEDHRPYHGYRDSRGQGYYRGARHDNSYQKDFHGGYQQSYSYKKYSYKSHRKEDDSRPRLGTPKPAQTGKLFATKDYVEGLLPENYGHIHKPGTPRKPENTPSKEDKSPAQEDSKLVQDGPKREDLYISAQHRKKPSENEVKLTEGGAEPSEEDTEHSDENVEHSKESLTMLDEERNSLSEGVKIKQEYANSDFDEQNVEPDTKKGILLTQKETKEEEVPITAGKRAYSEEGIYCMTEDDTEEASSFSKRVRTWQDEDEIHRKTTEEIPLLDGWPDMPSGSAEKADTSTQRHPEPNVKQELTDTAKDLRKAFILARKQEIELAFAQDCRTFAFVANTLLKKDPSMELAVTNALRSALQDIAGRCVQDLRSFVEQYDNVLVNTSNSLQK